MADTGHQASSDSDTVTFLCVAFKKPVCLTSHSWCHPIVLHMMLGWHNSCSCHEYEKCKPSQLVSSKLCCTEKNRQWSNSLLLQNLTSDIVFYSQFSFNWCLLKSGNQEQWQWHSFTNDRHGQPCLITHWCHNISGKFAPETTQGRGYFTVTIGPEATIQLLSCHWSCPWCVGLPSTYLLGQLKQAPKFSTSTLVSNFTALVCSKQSCKFHQWSSHTNCLL